MSQFSEETKKKVVKLHIQDGRIIASLSAEYGASKATISNWVHNYCEECRNNKENRFLKKPRHSSQRKSIRGLSIYHGIPRRIRHPLDAQAHGNPSQRLLQLFEAQESGLLCPQGRFSQQNHSI